MKALSSCKSKPFDISLEFLLGLTAEFVVYRQFQVRIGGGVQELRKRCDYQVVSVQNTVCQPLSRSFVILDAMQSLSSSVALPVLKYYLLSLMSLADIAPRFTAQAEGDLLLGNFLFRRTHLVIQNDYNLVVGR